VRSSYLTVLCRYRNKCAFTVGIDEETQLPTVGFRIGSYVNGVTGVGSIEALRHIPDSMKVAVKLFQEYVRSSDLQVFNFEVHTGYFRQLTVRTAQDQIMLVIGIHPQDLSDEKLKEFKESLVQYFTTGAGKQANVTSLYYQAIVKKSVFFIRDRRNFDFFFIELREKTLPAPNIYGVTLTFASRCST
jgi:tRNA (uracil-5-)-methyltransferase